MATFIFSIYVPYHRSFLFLTFLPIGAYDPLLLNLHQKVARVEQMNPSLSLPPLQRVSRQYIKLEIIVKYGKIHAGRYIKI